MDAETKGTCVISGTATYPSSTTVPLSGSEKHGRWWPLNMHNKYSQTGKDICTPYYAD